MSAKYLCGNFFLIKTLQGQFCIFLPTQFEPSPNGQTHHPPANTGTTLVPPSPPLHLAVPPLRCPRRATPSLCPRPSNRPRHLPLRLHVARLHSTGRCPHSGHPHASPPGTLCCPICVVDRNSSPHRATVLPSSDSSPRR
uniref:Uncharacterized protein n=1 Tax=Opuntia streptacantha TaxID=393608 RepID=A0A7C8YE68_OPUST